MSYICIDEMYFSNHIQTMWELAHKIGSEDYKWNWVRKKIEGDKSHISALKYFITALSF